MESRKLTIDQTVNIIDNKFNDLYYYSMPYGEDYYIHRIYPDGSLIAMNREDKCLYELTWSIGSNNEVTFSEKSAWKKVEETYVQSGEIGARSKPPFEKLESRGEQKRFYETRAAEVSQSGDGVQGMAIVTGARTLLYRTYDGVAVYEEIAPEAVQNYDFNEHDIVCTINHDFNQILGRTSSGTLQVRKETDGVFYAVDNLPNTTYGNNLKENLNRGDIKGSSFIFSIESETWEDLGNNALLRTVTAFDHVYELGPVGNAAYQQSTASKRSEKRNANYSQIEVKAPKAVLWELDLLELEMENIKSIMAQ